MFPSTPVLALAAFSLIQTASAPKAPVIVAATPTYRNAALAFTFSYPEGFQAAPGTDKIMEQASKESDADVKKALTCVTMPLLAVHQVNENSGEAIILTLIDYDCLHAPAGPESLPLLAEGSLKEGLARVGTPKLTPSVAYKLDDHDAAYIQGTVPVTAGIDKPGFGGTTCVLIGHHAACWTIFTSEQARLSLLLDRSTLAFGDRAANSLVPATIAAPKPADR